MSETSGFTVKISGSPELIDQLVEVAGSSSEMSIEAVGPADEPSHLRLGLAEVSTIVALVNGITTLGKFAWAIYKHLREGDSGQLTVQTPLRTVVIIGSDAVSEERIRQLLEDAVRP
jgi:hypothetical protein